MKACIFLFLFVLTTPVRAKSDSTVHEPRTHGPLTIWILDGDTMMQHPYRTLEQALSDGEAIIHNENSQTLWIENRSDSDLFLQAGDLIKGGQQDRMIASDRILPAHDTARDLQVYCIEQGRSTQRNAEPIETFSASHWMAPLAHTRLVARHELTEKLLTPHVGGLTSPDTNELKLFQSLGNLPQPLGTIDAAQESIWNDVTKVQSGLTETLRDSVTRNASPTSLELSLENNSLADREHSFENLFGDLATKDSHSIGFAYAIDGHIVGVEQYVSHDLFAAMWPKLLRSVAAAALSNPNVSPPSNSSTPSTKDVESFQDAPGNRTSRQSIDTRTLIEASKTDGATRFVTWDQKFLRAPLHAEWIATPSN
ncbi:MAG TPA: DUF6569 family protein [Candidatus Kapabacteria bacterium]|nr:DUF6569 family protein [Candidatus Kapabacteria bacterium]